VVKVYTGAGDDGTTGLLFGGRVPKDSARIEAAGTLDEAQALLGVVRAESEPGSELDELLISLERDLWILMAEVATAPENRRKLTDGKNRVTVDMVQGIETRIDELAARADVPAQFVVPGENRMAALLDVARTVVRRGERHVVSLGDDQASQVVPYLNRLSSLLWTMARWQEGEHRVLARAARTRRGAG
jgi:cob(I)alamin adenosyltransferase